MTSEEIMDRIIIEMDDELNCAKKSKWLMGRTLNPIRKLSCYLNFKRFMERYIVLEKLIKRIEREIEKEES